MVFHHELRVATHAHTGGTGPPPARIRDAGPSPASDGGVARRIEGVHESFGDESVDIQLFRGRIKVTVREFEEDKWQTTGKVEVVQAPDIPGFQIQRGEYSMAVEVGLLPSNKLFYRDCEQDKYLTLDDLTKRVLDRALFPKLRE